MAEGRHEIATRPIVCDVDTSEVDETRDHVFTGAGGARLVFDLYKPARAATRLATVVSVAGYPDEGFRRRVGCDLREMASYVSWSRLFAAAGCAAVTYGAADPAVDAAAILVHLRANAGRLGIDPSRIALWVCSGNAAAAVSLLAQTPDVRAVALLYPMLPPAAAATMPANVPMLLVRAGRDETPGVNASIDAFVAAVLERNLPLTLINHAAAPHAFDILDASDASRSVIHEVRDFLLRALGA